MRRAVRTAGLLASLAAVMSAAPSSLRSQDADLDGVAYELGSEDAPVVVVEYADFACGACGAFARRSWPTLRERFVETGRVRWRFVLFELGFRNSDEGARAGHCGAELGDFFALHDAIYEQQSRWMNEPRPKDALVAIAVEAGYDEEAFRDCYDDDPGDDRTKDANRAARRDGVRATPTFFINGFRIQGALPADVFAGLIEEAEAKR